MSSKLLSEDLKAFDNEEKKYIRSYVCKVPPSLRSLNEDAYEPQVVGLGPFHHDHPSLQRQRKFKLEALRRNLQRMRGHHGSLEEKLRLLHTEVENLQDEIMACYDEDLEFDGNNLILDACFVIEVAMVKAHKAEKMLERLTERSAFTRSVLCDILKLENQVPLFLLKLIISFQENVDCDVLVSILTWACRRVFLLPEEENQDQTSPEAARMLESSSDHYPAHLLEWLQRLILWKISEDKGKDNSHRNPDNASANEDESHSIKIDGERSQTKSSSIISQNKANQTKVDTNPSNATTNQRDFVSAKIDGDNSLTETNSIINQGNQGNSPHNTITTEEDSVTGKSKSIMRSVARAQNLARAGIAFKAGTPRRFEEKFCKMKGVLHLPALHTRTDTETLLRNVIAFEECYLVRDNNVSRFVLLMGCLIDKEEDVALLRNEGVIDNSMDSDQAVAEMFNGLTKHITAHYFRSDVTWEKLQKHYECSWRKMAKEFIDTHFSKPWIVCATVTAVLYLILTIVQTYYTIKPPQG